MGKVSCLAIWAALLTLNGLVDANDGHVEDPKSGGRQLRAFRWYPENNQAPSGGGDTIPGRDFLLDGTDGEDSAPVTPAPATAAPVTPAPTPTPFVTVKITFDDFPQETGWILQEESGDNVLIHVPYNTYQGIGYVEDTVDVRSGVTYTFFINDMVGDGLCCPNPGGTYVVEYKGVEVASGSGDFGYGESTTFTIP